MKKGTWRVRDSILAGLYIGVFPLKTIEKLYFNKSCSVYKNVAKQK